MPISNTQPQVATTLPISEANVTNLVANLATLTTAVATKAPNAILTVVHAPPTTFVTPLMEDDTAVTGALYGWTGSAYVKIAAGL